LSRAVSESFVYQLGIKDRVERLFWIKAQRITDKVIKCHPNSQIRPNDNNIMGQNTCIATRNRPQGEDII